MSTQPGEGQSRVLNVMLALCFSALFIATKRIVGRDAASANASASTASVFCRFTKG